MAYDRYQNATDLVAHIEGLRANTQYTFAVRVINGRRQSTWSMSVTNTTLEDGKLFLSYIILKGLLN